MKAVRNSSPKSAAALRVVSARSGVITALDVGSSKIACIIGREEADGIKVMGSALHESRGLRCGTVTSLDQVSTSIRETLHVAEKLAGVRTQEVILSVSCGAPKSVGARAQKQMNAALVEDDHLRELVASGKSQCREPGWETIQAAPISYVVDSTRGVRDPRGMFCERLGATFHGVAVQPGPLQNLRLAVENCHLRIAGQFFAPYASALSTLTPDEMSLGATVVEFGAGVTSIAVFLDDALVHVDSIPLGGANITQDIAKGLSTPLNAAERIKTLYGSAFAEIEEGTGMIEVPQMGEGEEGGRSVRRALLTRIIQSRVEETLTILQDRLQKSGFDVAAGRRAVLTGGAAQLAGVRELAARMLNKQVRLARPQSFPGLAAATAGPAYATAVGLLIAGASRMPERHDPAADVELEEQPRGFARWLGKSLFG